MVGTFQDSGGGSGSHFPLPSMNGNRSWRGSGRFAASRASRSRLDKARRSRPCITRRRIGEALALYAEQRAVGALNIFNADRRAVAVTEAKFVQVPLQMGFRNRVIGSDNAAFQDREKSFDGVGVNRTAHIFAVLVVDALAAKRTRGMASGMAFVGINQAAARNLLIDDGGEISAVHSRNMIGANVAAAFHQREYRRFRNVPAPTAPALMLVPVVCLAANIGFVDFNGAAFAAHRALAGVAVHGFANTHGKEPRALEGDAQGAMKLGRADALLAAANQMDRGQPVAHGDMAILENGSDLDGEGLAAGVALVQPDPVGF